MSLNLLFVNSSLTDGGSERAMSLVAQALVSRGHQVSMALVREKHRNYPIDSRIKILQLKYRSGKKVAILLQRLGQLRQLLRKGNYDYVVCYMWDLNVMTLISAIG